MKALRPTKQKALGVMQPTTRPKKLPSKFLPGTKLSYDTCDIIISQAGEPIGQVPHYCVLIKPYKPTKVEKELPQWGWVPAALLDRLIADVV